MNNSRTFNSARNAVFSSAGQLLQTLMAFLCRMVFIHTLSSEYLGLNGLFTNVLSILSLAELGIGSAIVFELYGALATNDTEQVKALMRVYKLIYTAVGTFIIVAGIVVMPFINYIVGDVSIPENIYLIYFLYLLNTGGSFFFSYRSALITADQKNYVVTTTNYLVIVVQDIVQIVILFLTKNYILYLSTQIIFTFIYNIIIFRIANRMFPYLKEGNVEKLDEEKRHRLFANARALIISKISYTLVNSTDSIIISAIAGVIDTGVISNYTLIINTVSGLFKKVITEVTASVGNLNATSDTKKCKDIFEEISILNFWASGWSAIGFILLVNPLIEVLFGTEYLTSKVIIIVIAVNYYTECLLNASTMYRNTFGIFRQGQFMNLITGVLNIIFSIVLGMQWGVFGILFATFISRIVSVLWYYPYTVFKYGFHESARMYYIKQTVYFAILIATYEICDFIGSLVDGEFVINFIVNLILAILIPNVVFFLTFCKNDNFKSLYKRLKNVLLSVIGRK